MWKQGYSENFLAYEEGVERVAEMLRGGGPTVGALSPPDLVC